MSREVTVHQHNLPATPSYSFEQIQRMSVSFANSKLFGVTNPDQALALMLYAQATGVAPPLVMRDYSIIHNTLAKKAEAILRDFQRSGGRVEWTKYSDEGVTGVFSHPFSKVPLEVTWDHKRAQQAELRPDMYKKFPAAMFRSRCISEAVRTIAPDATDQIYTPEEIQGMHNDAAVTDESVVSENQAVIEGAKVAKNAISEEELGEMQMSMDVKTLPELTVAFGRAYTRAKDANDERAKTLLKATYDSQKEALQAGAIDEEPS